MVTQIEEDEDEGAYINLTTRTRMDSLLDEEGDAEEESTLLSFCEKPDRSMALLDDYEMEELDFVNDDPSHRSGKLSLILSISNTPVLGFGFCKMTLFSVTFAK